MFSLVDYRSEKEAILNNEDWKESGKQKALARLKKAGKVEARKEIKELRKSAVINALKLRDAQAKRLEKIGQAIGSMDYARLNYEAEAIRSQIEASDSLVEIESLWESAKSSNDPYILKAWKETSKGLITQMFGSESDYSGIKETLFSDITEAKVKVKNSERTEVELKALSELTTIEGQAKGINEAFGKGQAVVNRVLNGIRFENGQVELGFEREVNVFDKLEKDFEVFNRLESEREKAIENHKEVTKGFGALDYDFDDLSGAF